MRGRFFHDGVDFLEAIFSMIDTHNAITSCHLFGNFLHPNDAGARLIMDIQHLGERPPTRTADHVIRQQDCKGLVVHD